MLAVLLLALSGCSGSRGGGQEGFVGAEPSLTRVAPGDRKPAPVVSGRALGDDGELSTSTYAGRVVVLNVWGSWCSPCRLEAPDLQEVSRATAGTAQFLGVNTLDLDPAPAEAFVRRFGITYPSIYDPGGEQLLKFAEFLPPKAIPSTLVLDPDGRVAARVIGIISATSLTALVDDVAAGR